MEVYLARDADENLTIYRELKAHAEEIEHSFGGPMEWHELDGKAACRIAAPVEGQLFDEDSRWEELHDRMIGSMIALEAAFRPFLGKYRRGAKPEPAGEGG